MERRTTAKVRLLDAGYSLMLSKGYPATSVDEVCEAAEVSKGSFYHHFKSKQELAMAVLGHHMDGAKEVLEAGLDLEGLQGARRAIGYVKHVEEGAEDLWCDGCLIGSFALEIAETNPELRAKVSEIFIGLADHFEQVFTPLCVERSASTAPSPRELAEQFIMVIEGGVVLSRAHLDRSYVTRAIRCFRRYLESLAEK